MSGAEALAVIGAIASIASLADLSLKWISRIKNVYKDGKSLPEALKELESILPLLTRTLQQTQELITEQQVDEETCKAIRPTVNTYESKLNEINRILENTAASDGTSKRQRLWKALSSRDQERKVEKLAVSVQGYIPLLACQHIMAIRTRNCDVSALLKGKEEDAERDLLQSLSFRSMDLRYNAIEPPLSGTCMWLLENTLFQSWSNTTANLTQQQRFLWLKAKAGAGKSTLMKSTFEKVRQREKNSICTSFFFNARGQTLDVSFGGLLSSLLFQLLTQCQSLIQPLLKNSIFGLSSKRDCWKWDFLELKALFSHCIRSLQSKTVLVFIDAVDECDEEEARSIIKYLKQLSLDCEHLRVCISSRFYPHITAECQEIDMEHRVTEDIETYITSSLPKKLDGQDSAATKQKIVQKASGVFLWVVLVVGEILAAHDSGESFSSIMKIIERVPGDLKDALGLAMQKIRPESYPKISLVFKWMLLASEPLHPSEVVALIRFDSDSTVVGGMAPSSWDFESTEKIIRAHSGGLLEVKYAFSEGSERRPYVQFIHESVREYLQSSATLQRSDISNDTMSSQDHHSELANVCMDYLSCVPNFWEGIINHDTMSKDLGILMDRYEIIIALCKSNELILHKFPTRGSKIVNLEDLHQHIYASELRKVRSTDDKFSNILPKQRSRAVYFSASDNEKEIKEVLRAYKSAPLLHTLSRLLTEWTDVHIFAALQLLSKAARRCGSLKSALNKEAAQRYNLFGSSFPLMRRAVCELFVHTQKASDKDKTEARILEILGGPKSASMRNIADAATNLSQRGFTRYKGKQSKEKAPRKSNIGSPDTPSHFTVVLRLLLGFDLAVILGEHLSSWPGSADGVEEHELLLHAFQNKSPHVAALLLHRGLRISIEPSDTYMARTVTTWDHAFLAELFHHLMVFDADKRELTDIASHLLSLSVTFGNPEALEYLATNGADFNVPNNKAQCPLIQIARADSEQCADSIQILLECGADPNFTDSYGRSCLHYLASRANIAGIERLLKGNPMINIKDNYGETPWDFADSHGNDDVVELLTLHGGKSGRVIDTVGEARLSQEHHYYDSDQWELSGSDDDLPWCNDVASEGDFPQVETTE